MNQYSPPTLAAVPGILLRTVLRLFARVIFFLAGFFLFAGLALVYVSILVATWRSPRGPRVQAVVDFIIAAIALVKVLTRA